jgi:hypothetical protein
MATMGSVLLQQQTMKTLMGCERAAFALYQFEKMWHLI